MEDDDPKTRYIEAVRRFVHGLDPWDISASAFDPNDPTFRDLDPRLFHTSGAWSNVLLAAEAWNAIDTKQLPPHEHQYLWGLMHLMARLTRDAGIRFGSVTEPKPIPPDHPDLVAIKRWLDHPFARDVESAWVAKQLMRNRHKNPALLVTFMAGKDEAEVQAVEAEVQKADGGGRKRDMNDNNIRQLIYDTNEQLKSLGASFLFAKRPGKIIRESFPR